MVRCYKTYAYVQYEFRGNVSMIILRNVFLRDRDYKRKNIDISASIESFANIKARKSCLNKFMALVIILINIVKSIHFFISGAPRIFILPRAFKVQRQPLYCCLMFIIFSLKSYIYFHIKILHSNIKFFISFFHVTFLSLKILVNVLLLF